MMLAAAMGLAFVLVLEGMAYSLAPAAMKGMMARLLAMPDEALRAAGLACLGLGILALWLMRVMFV
jgi:uncharacterized protein